MKKATKNAAQKISKATSKGKAAAAPKVVDRVHAGGGIMVDIVDSKPQPQGKAAKGTKGKAAAKAPAKPQNAAGAPPKAATPTEAYRKGAYWGVVNALHAMGSGVMHPLDKVVPAIKKAMGADLFKAYAAKKGKLTADERLIVACAVTARSDYGAPLRRTGWETRFSGRTKEIGLFKVGSK